MDTGRRFDPRLLFEANRSFGWIFKCRSVYVARRNASLKDLLAPHMHGDACDLIRRIRNSLSHGRFEIDDGGVFTLRDQSASGTNPFETQIHFSRLGEFAEQFGKLILKSFPPVTKSH